jgi:arylsulfatase A-like enzyme
MTRQCIEFTAGDLPMRTTLFLAAILTLCTLARAQDPPNIVLVFIDDQGYNDVGCYGAVGFETPNIDRIAAEGIKFTNFYVSQAVCSASRASLLTGCYANRVGILGALFPSSKNALNPEEETIAEVLKARGYATAIFGKWHLGHKPPFLPLQHGFDEYLGLPYSNDMWPVGYDGKPLPPEHWKAKRYPPLPLIDGDTTIETIDTLEEQGQLTKRYTERAVAFIEKNRNQPFFLYLPHSMGHVPLGASPAFRGSSEQGLYGDVMQEIDWSVGQILETLDRLDLADNTLVIYTSDNGPWMNFGNHAGSAFPLREGKGTMWEGGCRVPAVMRLPGVIPAGLVTGKVASTIDILPTLVELTGAKMPTRTIDGVSILPLLRGDADANPRDEFWFYYGRQLQAVRKGKWKLHLPHQYRSYQGVRPGMDGFPGPYEKGRTGYELYNMDDDPKELRNVADEHPEVVERLRAVAETARAQLGDSNMRGVGQREPGKVD